MTVRLAKRGQSGMTWFTYKRTPNAGGEEQKDVVFVRIAGWGNSSVGRRADTTDRQTVLIVN